MSDVTSSQRGRAVTIYGRGGTSQQSLAWFQRLTIGLARSTHHEQQGGLVCTLAVRSFGR